MPEYVERKESCFGCDYYTPELDDSVDPPVERDQGRCMRFAPTELDAMAGKTTSGPMTALFPFRPIAPGTQNWCGEFKPVHKAPPYQPESA